MSDHETRLSQSDGEALGRQAGGFRKRWLFGLAVPALALAGYLVWQYYSVRESTDDAQIDGRIHAISARVGGTVLSVNVDDNQEVEAGTVLVRIDPRDYEVAAQRARADLAEAEASLRASRTDIPIVSRTTASRLSGAEAGVLEAEARVVTADRQLQSARARETAARARLVESQSHLARLGRDLERYKVLLDKDELSQQQYDATASGVSGARAQVDVSRAQVTEAEESVRAAQSQIEREKAALAQARSLVDAAGTAPDQVALTHARVASAAARLEQARAMVAQSDLNLQYTEVRSPVRGIVSKRSVETGQTVQPGQPLMAVVPLDRIWVTANFKETQLRSMRPGQTASISVDAYGGRKYRGRVDSIGAATGARFSLLPPENATGNFVKVVQRLPVKIVLEADQDREHLLRPGMSVDATVFTK